MEISPPKIHIASEEIDQRICSRVATKSIVYTCMKRLIDIGISLPMVIFVLPALMVLVAILHACVSRGALFYRQDRCGKSGSKFSIFKFRTMTPVSEDQRLEEADCELRIFPGARLIRYSKIDEVPQFINVLRGEMSIVGPRPHHFQDCAKFEIQVPGYRRRHVVKPGITGLAQIREYAGDFDWDCTESRVAADLEYLQYRNTFSDIGLILRTLSTIGWKCQQQLWSAVVQVRSFDADNSLLLSDLEDQSDNAEVEEDARRAA